MRRGDDSENDSLSMATIYCVRILVGTSAIAPPAFVGVAYGHRTTR